MEIRAILKAQTDAAADSIKPAPSSNLLLDRLEEGTTCTLLIRYIRENFKISTFSRLSGTF